MGNLTVTINKTGNNYTFSGSGDGTVNSQTGEINLVGQTFPMTITWEIGTGFGTGVTFATGNNGADGLQITVPQGIFSSVRNPGNNTSQLQVTDTSDAAEKRGYEYALIFSDGSKIDPRIINR